MKNRYKKLFDLNGKVAIITGSSRGIGASIAEALAEFGASVVVSSRSQESIDKVANKIIENGFDATPCACHVGDESQLRWQSHHGNDLMTVMCREGKLYRMAPIAESA